MNDARQNRYDQQTAGRLYRYKRKIIVGVVLVLTLTIAATMAVIAAELKARLLDDSKVKTRELGQAIRLSFGNLMLVRNPDNIQKTLETIKSGESSILKAFILNKNGRIAYSSDTGEIGLVIDRFREKSCTGCHTGPVAAPRETTMIMRIDGREVLRNVEIIHNDKPCHVCHNASDRINGKLIIDRSMQPTSALIARVRVMLAASGVFCLIFLAPFLSRVLSRGLDTYINEILLKSTELSLLYRIVERLSKTIDLGESRRAVIEIVREILDADEIGIVFPKEGGDYGGIAWKKSGNEIERMKFPAEDPDRRLISAWAGGGMKGATVSEASNEVAMAIAKGGSPLALVIARKYAGGFDKTGISLVHAMESHIAVALENAALYQIAITDSLTGLFTQRYFRTFLEKQFALSVQRGENLTLLMIDVDNFKKINDTFGHPAGDQVLKSVGKCILSVTREKDGDFRYGGEEFSVILPAVGATGGELVAERIRKKIEHHAFIADGQRLSITVSIGLASCPGNAAAIRDLIAAADKALYEAKRTGKNRVVASREVPGGDEEAQAGKSGV